MKSDFHFHFYSRIAIMLVLAVSLFMIQKSVPSIAEIDADPYEVTGWAWNESARWLSLNCYNDFDEAGVYVPRCSAPNVAYKIEITQSGDFSGCAWAGNNLSGGTSPLGWVCFDDPFTAYRSTPAGLGVSTSTTYLNALDTSTFASIVARENWRCSGGANPGVRCTPGGSVCTGGGTCAFDATDESWRLGFPINYELRTLDEDQPSASNPIEGCFNCYEEYLYKCDVSGVTCNPSTGCPLVGTPPAPQNCVVYSTTKKCDNCLEYFYYPGRCENTDPLDGIPDGTISASLGCSDFVSSYADCCTSNDQCGAGETCQPVSSCVGVVVGTQRYEYNCTPVGGVVPHQAECAIFGGCIQREVGQFRKVIGAYDCSNCTIESYDNRCTESALQANINSCQSCDSLWHVPGVMVDNKHYNLDTSNGERALMCGWAWNAWDETGDGIADNGLYWFQFAPKIVTSTIPYLSVESGNIYSQKGIRSDYLPPFGYYNSSYLIESGGSITNFISSSTLSGVYEGEIPYRPTAIDFPTQKSGGRFTNVLGAIDYNGLLVDVDPPNRINKFGSRINLVYEDIAVGNLDFISDLDDRGQVYYYSSDLTINNGGGVATYSIAAGSGSQTASKVIVVNGDLTLGDNFTYPTGVSYDRFKNIPSIVWIVRGDLLVDADVSGIVGNFIVLGNGTDCDPLVDDCGQFVSCIDTNLGDGITCRSNPLVVRGSVMARYFDLGRTFINNTSPQPAEQFINDGRLQVNPPKGFEDVSRVVPRFTEY